jgi:hypothetical protein
MRNGLTWLRCFGIGLMVMALAAGAARQPARGMHSQRAERSGRRPGRKADRDLFCRQGRFGLDRAQADRLDGRHPDDQGAGVCCPKREHLFLREGAHRTASRHLRLSIFRRGVSASGEARWPLGFRRPPPRSVGRPRRKVPASLLLSRKRAADAHRHWHKLSPSGWDVERADEARWVRQHAGLRAFPFALAGWKGPLLHPIVRQRFRKRPGPLLLGRCEDHRFVEAEMKMGSRWRQRTLLAVLKPGLGFFHGVC